MKSIYISPSLHLINSSFVGIIASSPSTSGEENRGSGNGTDTQTEKPVIPGTGGSTGSLSKESWDCWDDDED